MRSFFLFVFVLILSFSFVRWKLGYAQQGHSSSLVESRPSPKVLTDTHDVVSGLGLANDRITNGNLLLVHKAEELLSTDSGRQTLTLMIACALPSTAAVNTSDPNIQFSGESGLAPEWRVRGLGNEDKELVSACMFSHLSAEGLASSISMRGPDPHLKPSADEIAGWPIEEGAFFGNFFGQPGKPIIWFACAGQGQILVPDATGLKARGCSVENPNQPGFTKCGLVFAGDCKNICERPLRKDFYVHCQSPNYLFRPVTTYVQK